MKVAILAGGFGTRISEETEIKPKPMVTIGQKPILWHIMKIYAHFGFSDFVIALGYKGAIIKKFMIDYYSMSSNLTVNLADGSVSHDSHNGETLDWKVQMVDTGLNTMTGGRIKRLQPVLGDETFMLTWGDGLADINIPELIEFHRSHGKLATMTAVRPTARYGHIEIDHNQIMEFSEKPQTKAGWINGAFFVLEPGIFDYIKGDDTQWEAEPLENLAKDGELMAYKHSSFWQCMDTLREKYILEKYWSSGEAPWKIWSD